jgi:hypothetical protein
LRAHRYHVRADRFVDRLMSQMRSSNCVMPTFQAGQKGLIIDSRSVPGTRQCDPSRPPAVCCQNTSRRRRAGYEHAVFARSMFTNTSVRRGPDRISAPYRPSDNALSRCLNRNRRCSDEKLRAGPAGSAHRTRRAAILARAGSIASNSNAVAVRVPAAASLLVASDWNDAMVVVE